MMLKTIYILFISLVFNNTLFSQETPVIISGESNIKIENRNVVNDDGVVTVDFEISLDKLTLDKNHQLIVTPILVSADNSEQIFNLPGVIINGKRQATMHERSQIYKNKTYLGIETLGVYTRKNGEQQKILYSYSLPFSEWHSNSSLVVREEIRGCAECEISVTEHVLVKNLFPEVQPYLPLYKVTYIMPDVDPVKSREDLYSATLNFRVSKHDLDPNYLTNDSILNEANKIVSSITENPDLEVDDFIITGYASPEGNFSSNKALSERRANSFADYLSDRHKISRSRMIVNGYGEDWEGLRKIVEASSLIDKYDILNIIDNEVNHDERDVQLMKLSDGESYRLLLNNYYPPLRRTDYKVSYRVRPFDIEEAKVIIKTNPKLLSLNEMFLVAQTYAVDSNEYKEVFDIAVRLYPNNPIAIVNSAAADIEVNNFQAALRRLEKIKDKPIAWNNLGLAYALSGELNIAIEYFRKAVSEGDVDAINNLNEIKKLIED